MYLKFVSKDYKAKQGSATFQVGEVYENKDSWFHYFDESIIESTHANYFPHVPLEELRLLEIEPIGVKSDVLSDELELPYELPYEKGSFTAGKFKVLREVDFDEVLTSDQKDSISHKVKLSNSENDPDKVRADERNKLSYLARLKKLIER